MNTNLVLASIIIFMIADMTITVDDLGSGEMPQDHLAMAIAAEDENLSSKEEVDQLFKFIEAIGELESNNTYDVVNRWGMLGKYQFSPTTIEHLGYDVSDEEFLSSPELQDEVMMAYLRENYDLLQDYILEYDGKVYKGFEISTASILAGAHFAGPTGLRRFLDNLSDSTGVVDSNGMTLRKYMQTFSDYTIEDLQ